MIDRWLTLRYLLEPALIALALWLAANAFLNAELIAKSGGSVRLLTIMMAIAFGFAGLSLGFRGFVGLIEMLRERKRVDWTWFPNPFDGAMVCGGVSLAIVTWG